LHAASYAYRDWMRTPVPERADYLLRAGLILYDLFSGNPRERG
jgi:acyl-CoA reductase-like NAD-dependent aldehyde dehydrogenase